MKNESRFSAVIKSYRKILGLSARALSKMVGRHPQFIAGVERIGSANFETLSKLINFFGTNPVLVKRGESVSSVAVALWSGATGVDIQTLSLINQTYGIESDLQNGDEVWIVGNYVSYEFELLELRKGNLSKGVHYSFFLRVADHVWEGFVNRLSTGKKNG